MVNKIDSKKTTKEQITKTPTIEEQFKKKTHHEHILDPTTADSYIGSIHNDLMPIYVYDEQENRIVKKDKHIVLGLYKIFDEILVNAADNTVRDKKCNKIEVDINEVNGEISVKNNGSTIPIEVHKEYNIYVPELIFGNLLTSGNYDQKGKIVGGKNGYGSKCLGINTLIPLYDGTIKKASDIAIGDKLIGDDGKERTVINIIKGNSQMYEITQSMGEKYTVNNNHTLTLHMPDHKVIFWNNHENGWSVLWWNNEEKCINEKTIKIEKNKLRFPECNTELNINTELNSNLTKDYEIKLPIKTAPDTIEVKQALEELKKFCSSISDDNTIDINIQDYMNLNKTTKTRLAGIRGDCVQWEYKDVEIDPYMLGLWLGDEDKHGYVHTYDGKKNEQHLKTQLEKYNLLKNKYIPIDYIVNDKEIRLKVLAGIIDTNSTVSRDETKIVIKQGIVHEQLTRDIIYLARTLGFSCSLNEEKKTSDGFMLNISGNIDIIPTKLPRKECKNKLIHSSKSTGSINIADIGEGDYIGIEIDSNQRFLINDFTVTHNCANIYSTRFDVEICDPIRKKKYFQRFTNNMYNKEEPIITTISSNEESYTKITFIPDYKRFGLTKLTSDMVGLIKRRVYDIAGTTNENVNVWLNGNHLNIKSFKDYIGMYYNEDSMPNLIYEEFNERWTLGVLYDPNSGFQHMSFVNKISTFKGGTHLDYITKQIVDKVTEHILSQPKYKTLKIRPHQIKDNLTIFINSVIEDPSFGSQSKEELSTKASTFNIKCELGEKFIEKICKTGLINEIVQIAQIKQMGELEKSDGKKTLNLKSLTKLDDARLAGSKRSTDCRLILTEGDSAKTCAISGLEIIGRDLYGVFPLKGKLLNVRDATPNQLLSNEEIKNIKQILGLKQNTVYTDTKKLRYGGILILTDADVDGSHIKGLLINFFHYFWPDLLKIDGFIQSIATPIIKAYKNTDTKKANPEIFYTQTEYKKWCEKLGDEVEKKYKIKYYKGLGTSTASESKEYFVDFDNKLINYVWNMGDKTKLISNTKSDPYNNIDELDNGDNGDNGDREEDDEDREDHEDNISLKSSKSSKSSKVNSKLVSRIKKSDDDNISICSEHIDKNEPSYQAITLAFAKNRANDRKEWVKQRDENLIIENNVKKIPVYDFINKDLIHFSHEDNLRSIPDLIDGLKPSQRKILYGAFKRKLDNEEIKVAQLAGYISEHTGYHHGEASLQGAIINMAQNYCGSNNINLLYPSGNFGTRRLGGKDSASPRYIFTQLSTLTRNIFISKDEFVLENVIEEGDVVEPIRYYPIIPMILVNGSEGIGTGYSTNIPPYNPLDIIENIRAYLKGTNVSELNELTPWYSGFTGRIEKNNDKKNQLKYISYGRYEQLDEYTLRITELPVGIWTQSYIDFLSKLIEDGNMITDYENNCGNHKIDFKITFRNGELQKLIKANIIEEKLKLTSSIQVSNMHVYKNNEIVKYSNPNVMIKEYADIRLDIYKKRKEYWIKVLENELQLLKYRRRFIKEVTSKKLIISNKPKATLIEELGKNEFPELSTNINSKPSYDYLVGMPLWNLTQEKIDELESNYNEKKQELDTYKNTTIQSLWLGELDLLQEAYKKWEDDKINTLCETTINKKKKTTSKKIDDKKIDDKKIDDKKIDDKKIDDKKIDDKKIVVKEKKNKSTISKDK